MLGNQFASKSRASIQNVFRAHSAESGPALSLSSATYPQAQRQPHSFSELRFGSNAQRASLVVVVRSFETAPAGPSAVHKQSVRDDICAKCVKMPTTADCDFQYAKQEWLLAELRGNSKNLVVLDCRSSNEYGESHIRDAVNFSIPSIMLRRLAAGKIDLASTIKCRELKQKICSTYKENLFVLYNDASGTQQQGESILSVLMRRLTQDGCQVVALEGKYPF